MKKKTNIICLCFDGRNSREGKLMIQKTKWKKKKQPRSDVLELRKDAKNRGRGLTARMVHPLQLKGRRNI